MRVAVFTRDHTFFSAVEGLAGAMGHATAECHDPSALPPFDVLIADLGKASGTDVAELATADPLRTVAFVPPGDAELLQAVRAAALAQVHRRGALAQELPRILREYA